MAQVKPIPFRRRKPGSNPRQVARVIRAERVRITGEVLIARPERAA